VPVRDASSSGPTVSVVLPVYDVAGYLAECLESILTQSMPDFEIVAVDDGSTDTSPAILADYADRDPRLRVVRQPNAGLGAARNTGIDAARGQFLWFVDSDDLLAPGALQALLSPLTATGSDFATGNAWRLTADGPVPARFLAPVFRRTRLRTHIRRFPALLADRTAWNKLFRRSFWDRHGFRFPVGVHYEDIYVTLPAHYSARAVDVVDRYVYLWRVRAEGDTSITQRRAEIPSMLDRFRAVEHVSRHLADLRLGKAKREYDLAAISHDLRYFLDVVPAAGEDYRSAFVAAANRYLDGVDPRVLRELPATQRLEWELVRRGAGDELAALLADRDRLRAVRRGRRWMLDTPVRERSDLGLPERTFRVRRELRLVSRLHELSAGRDGLTIRGSADVDLLGDAGRPDRLRLVAVPTGRGRPVLLPADVDRDGGFTARVRADAFDRAGGAGRWRLIAVARVAGLRRVAVWHEREPGVAASAAGLTASGRELRLDLLGRGELIAGVGAPARVREVELDGDVLQLAGPAGTLPSGEVTLQVTTGAEVAVEVPAHVDRLSGERWFLARLPVGQLAEAAGHHCDPPALQVAGRAWPLVWHAAALSFRFGDVALSVVTGPDGYAGFRVTSAV
jgi:glycosyltransferase involved in cell wall biosynthesis